MNSHCEAKERLDFCSDLVYMNLYDEGQAYTEQEHRDWLAEAGFEGFERIDVPQGRVIITAGKPR